MASKKQTKVITRRRKFIEVSIPLLNSKVELIGNSNEEIKDKTIKLDLTRQLKGKSVEGTFKVNIENEKPIANPLKIKLMPYFIRRMIRKRISYVEDSFETPSRESIIRIKPFLITRKRVSRVVRKTLRNKTRNWIEDYLAERDDQEIFEEILSNKLQKPLSLVLKKTYPLSLCEIRILEIKRPLNPDEISKIPKKKKIIEEKPKEESEIGEGLDQFKEIEEEKIKRAQEEMKEAQSKASDKEKEDEAETKKELKEAKKEIKSDKEEEKDTE